MALHTFDDDNGIVHHQADGQHQPEHRKGIEGEAEKRKSVRDGDTQFRQLVRLHP